MEKQTISVPSTTCKEQYNCCSKGNCNKQQIQINTKDESMEEKTIPMSSTTCKEQSGCCSKSSCNKQPIQCHTKNKSASSNINEKIISMSSTTCKEQSSCCSKGNCNKQQIHCHPKDESVSNVVEEKISSVSSTTCKDQSGCCSKSHCHKEKIQINIKNEPSSFTEPNQQQKQQSVNKLVFKIEGLCCGSEAAVIKEVLNPLLQGRDAILSFDLINAKAIIESKNSSNLPNKYEVMKAVAKTGMKATLWTDHVKEESNKNKTFWQRHGRTIMNLVSAVCLVIGFIIETIQNRIESTFGHIDSDEKERPDFPHVATMVFYSICVVSGGWFIFPKAAMALKRLKPNTKLLTVIATAGAIAINEWFEAAFSMYLFSAAELLEAWNMARARKSIRLLMALAPSTAQVLNEDGTVTEQPVEQVPIGSIILIKPGEKIPMDCELISGFTSVNQAPITGESLPVQKEVGDPLFAGTINGDAAIQCKVTKAASDSTLASIIRKVEEAQSNRAQTDQWIENFALYYVPLMMIASLVVAIIPPLVTDESWYSWIAKGLELLVISCPCSLIISTPVSIVAGITAAAKSGVLIKGGIHLENAAHLQAFAMDKTGTITTGEPVVHNIIPLDGYTSEEILKLAAALEIHSDHPLARAIQRKAKEDAITFESAQQFQIIKGKGAEGYIQDSTNQCEKVLPSEMDTLTSGAKAALVATMASSSTMVLAGADPSLLMGLVILLQMLYYIIFFNVNYPNNVESILGVFKVGRFDFLPNPFKWYFDGLPKLESPPKFEENDIPGLFLYSAGPIVFIYILSILTYLFCILAAKTRTFLFPKIMRSLALKIFPYFGFSGCLRLIISCYLDLMLCSLLQLRVLHFEDYKYTISSLLAIVVISISIILLFYSFYVLHTTKFNRKTLDKYEPLVEDYDININTKKYFGAIVLTRRTIYSLSIVLLYYIPLLQSIVPWMANLVYLVLLIVYRPHHKNKMNIVDTLTEVGFFGIHSCVVVFAVDDIYLKYTPEMRENLGWGLISLCVFVIMVQGCVVIKENIDMIKTLIQHICMRKKLAKTTDKPKAKKIPHSIILNPEFITAHKRSRQRKSEFKSRKQENESIRIRMYLK